MNDVMTHEEKVIVYTLGLIESGLKTGMVQGGRLRLDPEGLEEYEKLKREGFRPTPSEIETAYVLLSDPPEKARKLFQKKKSLLRKLLEFLGFVSA